MISELINSGLLNLAGGNITTPTPKGNHSHDTQAIKNWLILVKNFCTAREALFKVEAIKNKFQVAFNNVFHYEFSQGDLDRIQQILNTLREQISNAALKDEHKQRLLRRLEKLQSELHKKVSDLDRFWGLIGDAGVVLGKLGTDAKPIVDRIREISDIVWNTQSRSEELPSGTQPPMLENKPTSSGSLEA